MVSDQQAIEYIGSMSPEELKRFDPSLTIENGSVKLSISKDDLVRKVKIYIEQRSTTISPLLKDDSKFINPRSVNLRLSVDAASVGDFQDTSEEGISRARQALRRSEAYKKLAEDLTVNRVNPGASSNIIYINIDQLRKLQKDYEEAVNKGIPRSRIDFLPLSAYAANLSKIGSPILENEIGRFQMGSNPSSNLVGKIAVLRDKDLSINTFVIGRSR